MNNEIKFDHFENINELLEHIDLWYKEEDIYYERWFGLNDLKKLKDYITNLQEENEDLREENKEAHDFDETLKDIKDNLIARINRQECEIHNLKAKLEMYENGVYFSSENDKLQERIDKAIEFIEEELTFYITIGGTDERKLIGYNKAFDELLDILKGSDKE